MRDFSKEIEQLRPYRNKPDKDDVFYKELVKKEVLKDDRIIYLLNNKELEDVDAENDEYFGIIVFSLICSFSTFLLFFLMFLSFYSFSLSPIFLIISLPNLVSFSTE